MTPRTPSRLAVLALSLSACVVEDPEAEPHAHSRSAELQDEPTVGYGVALGHPDALADADAWTKFVQTAVAAYGTPSEPKLTTGTDSPDFGAFASENPALVKAAQALPSADWLDPSTKPVGAYCDPLEDPDCGCADLDGDGTLDCDDTPPADDPEGPWDECERPPVPKFDTYGCSESRKLALWQAFEYSHYMGWRANQLLTHIRGVNETVGPELAEQRWAFQDNKFSPSLYWGDFDEGRMEAVQETVSFVYETYFVEDHSVTIACYDDPDFKDIFNPKLLAAKVASPCFFNFWPTAFTVANAAFIGLPWLHPKYPFPTIEVCDEFFAWPDEDIALERGRALYHEMFHWLVNPSGSLRDKHTDCKSIGDGDKHCQPLAEIQALADAHPTTATRNIYAYDTFARNYGDLYFEGGGCGSKAICFDDFGICPADPDDGPPPVPPECEDLPHGTCEGGECALIDALPSYTEQLDPFSAAHPDGDFSLDTYCEGPDLVCVNEGGGGRCRKCEPGQRMGCPCDEDSACDDAGLTCWGGSLQGWPGSQGRCWDPVAGPPAFQCAQGCEGRSDYLGNADYVCFHDTNVVDKATCLTLDCAQPEAFCAADDLDMVCDGMTCAPMCEGNADCSEAYGWPPGTLCDGVACVPPIW
jgi:hypothetical protein